MQIAVWSGTLETVDVIYTTSSGAVDWQDKKVFQAQDGKGTVPETGRGQFDEKQNNTEVINSKYNQDFDSWYNEDKKDPSERGARGQSGISQHAEARWLRS